uniref:Uncharacterized protein n=1 Tax=Leersia perrieri TaxID=77586 RepID=A0A0G2KBI5_9ORYZ
MRRSLASC